MRTLWIWVGVVALLIGAAWALPKALCLIDACPTPPERMKEAMPVLRSKLDNFRLDCGRYPTTSEGLKALADPPPKLVGRWAGPYLDRQRAETDPWGRPYVYVSRSADTYEVVSYGADGKPDGEGYDADLKITD